MANLWMITVGMLCTNWNNIRETLAENVALHKSVSLCTNEVLPTLLTDGDRNTSKNVVVDGTGKCWPEFFIQINLGHLQKIKSVTLFEGDPSHALTGREMDFFEVRYSHDGSVYDVCNYYPNLSKGPSVGTGMTLNCKESGYWSISMRIMFTNYVALGFNLAEIEIHTTDFPSTTIYRGCVKNFVSNYWSQTSGVEDCRDYCRMYKMFALSKKTLCYCGEGYDLNDEVSLINCPHICDGMNCGGPEAYAVYLEQVYYPAYQGCNYFTDFKKDKNLVFAADLQSMTVGICLKLCDNFIALVLQNGTVCYCTKMYYRHLLETSTKLCNVKCGGNPTAFCGGEDYGSVYSTCTWQNYEATKCTFVFRCKREMNEYGSCPYGCQNGWTGSSCLARDTSVDVEMDCILKRPCDRIANSRCILTDFLSECVCLQGFYKDLDDRCLDIDECEERKCDLVTSICLNRIGSYYCQCNEYTFRLSNFTCLGNLTKVSFLTLTSAFLISFIPMVSALLTALLCCCIPLEQRKNLASYVKGRA